MKLKYLVLAGVDANNQKEYVGGDISVNQDEELLIVIDRALDINHIKKVINSLVDDVVIISDGVIHYLDKVLFTGVNRHNDKIPITNLELGLGKALYLSKTGISHISHFKHINDKLGMKKPIGNINTCLQRLTTIK